MAPMTIKKMGLWSPFLTDVFVYAAFYASTRAANVSVLETEPISDPIVLEVEVDEKNLEADVRPYAVPPQYLLAEWSKRLGLKRAMGEARWKKLVKDGTVPYPLNTRDWQTTLAAVRSVRHVGRLPADQIVKVHELSRQPNPIEACGDCYRYAFRTAVDYLKHNSPPPLMVIAHGWARHPSGPLEGQDYAHAWAERGGLVYDWQTIEHKRQPPMTVEAFYAKYQPHHIDTFTPIGLMRWTARYDHYGPFGKPWWVRKVDKPRHVR